MWDFCQIAKHVLCNIRKTDHKIDAKPTEHFTYTIIKHLLGKVYYVIKEFYSIIHFSISCE